MPPEDERAPKSPALIDVEDEAQLNLVAEHLETTPEEVLEAVEEVGPDLADVEEHLDASPPSDANDRLGDILRAP